MPSQPSTRDALEAWLAAPASLRDVAVVVPGNEVDRWLRALPGEVIRLEVGEGTRLERDALVALDQALALPPSDDDDDDDEPDLEGLIARIDQRIWGRGATALEDDAPGPPVLFIDGLDRIIDASPRLWSTLVQRATRALGVHVLAARSALLFRPAPLPAFAVDAALVAQVEAIAAGTIDAGPVAVEAVRLGGAHLERASASVARRRALLSPHWFAAWRRERDWPIGFAADVRRFRKAAEDDALALARPDALVDVVEAAIVEGVARAHATRPASLEPSALAHDRATALAALAGIVQGAARNAIVTAIDQELAGVTATVTQARDALLVPRSDADAYQVRPPRLDELEAANAPSDPVPTWLDTLDDVAAVEQCAHLARFASPALARRLASQAAQAQIAGGDDDSLVQLGFVAHHLDAADAAAVVVARLGYHPLSRLLDPQLGLVAPFLARACEPDAIVAMTRVIRDKARPLTAL